MFQTSSERFFEQVANIELFDGGAFVSIGNEFDLFVVPESEGAGASGQRLGNISIGWVDCTAAPS